MVLTVRNENSDIIETTRREIELLQQDFQNKLLEDAPFLILSYKKKAEHFLEELENMRMENDVTIKLKVFL